MEITYDKNADAMYIRFSRAEFAKNKKIDSQTIIDIDSNNQLIGIEILDASKCIPKESISKVKLRNIGQEQ